MSLSKNNKYNNLKTIGLSAVLLSGMLLGGCNKNSEAVEVVPTIVAEVVEVPKTVATPQPSVKKSIITNEEIDSLGIVNPNEKTKISALRIMQYEKDDILKRAYTYFSNVNGNTYVYNMFSDDLMFLITEDNKDKSFNEIDLSTVMPMNNCLEGAIVTKIEASDYEEQKRLLLLEKEAGYIEIDIDKMLENLDVTITKYDLAISYLNLVSEENRVTLNDLRHSKILTK